MSRLSVCLVTVAGRIATGPEHRGLLRRVVKRRHIRTLDINLECDRMFGICRGSGCEMRIYLINSQLRLHACTKYTVCQTNDSHIASKISRQKTALTDRLP